MTGVGESGSQSEGLFGYSFSAHSAMFHESEMILPSGNSMKGTAHSGPRVSQRFAGQAERRGERIGHVLLGRSTPCLGESARSSEKVRYLSSKSTPLWYSARRAFQVFGPIAAGWGPSCVEIRSWKIIFCGLAIVLVKRASRCRAECAREGSIQLSEKTAVRLHCNSAEKVPPRVPAQLDASPRCGRSWPSQADTALDDGPLLS